MISTNTKRRRWLQFSLRTMLVLVTLVCVGFGWWVQRSKEWIRQRHQWLEGHAGIGSYGAFEPRAPGGLWLFGEDGVRAVLATSDEEQEAKRLFPEAAVTLGEWNALAR